MLVMLWLCGKWQVDPDLSRTVVVSTKLDTRIPQFASRADVELFLKPPGRLLDSNILGATPFFTSVPSGRVGVNRDSVYRSNDHFREVNIAFFLLVVFYVLCMQMTKKQFFLYHILRFDGKCLCLNLISMSLFKTFLPLTQYVAHFGKKY